jgi:hypothetical protein
MSETRRGFSLQGEINDLYQQYLGRDAEQAGMDYWLGTFASGSTLDDIERAIASSPEAQQRVIQQQLDETDILTDTVADDTTDDVDLPIVEAVDEERGFTIKAAAETGERVYDYTNQRETGDAHTLFWGNISTQLTEDGLRDKFNAKDNGQLREVFGTFDNYLAYMDERQDLIDSGQLKADWWDTGKALVDPESLGREGGMDDKALEQDIVAEGARQGAIGYSEQADLQNSLYQKYTGEAGPHYNKDGDKFEWNGSSFVKTQKVDDSIDGNALILSVAATGIAAGTLGPVVSSALKGGAAGAAGSAATSSAIGQLATTGKVDPAATIASAVTAGLNPGGMLAENFGLATGTGVNIVPENVVGGFVQGATNELVSSAITEGKLDVESALISGLTSAGIKAASDLLSDTEQFSVEAEMKRIADERAAAGLSPLSTEQLYSEALKGTMVGKSDLGGLVGKGGLLPFIDPVSTTGLNQLLGGGSFDPISVFIDAQGNQYTDTEVLSMGLSPAEIYAGNVPGWSSGMITQQNTIFGDAFDFAKENIPGVSQVANIGSGILDAAAASQFKKTYGYTPEEFLDAGVSIEQIQRMVSYGPLDEAYNFSKNPRGISEIVGLLSGIEGLYSTGANNPFRTYADPDPTTGGIGIIGDALTITGEQADAATTATSTEGGTATINLSGAETTVSANTVLPGTNTTISDAIINGFIDGVLISEDGSTKTTSIDGNVTTTATNSFVGGDRDRQIIVDGTKTSDTVVDTGTPLITSSGVVEDTRNRQVIVDGGQTPETVVDPTVVTPETVVDPTVVTPETVVDTTVVTPETVVTPPVVTPETVVDPTVVTPETVVDPTVILPETVVDPKKELPPTTTGGGGGGDDGGGRNLFGGSSMFEPQNIGLPGMGDPALLAALQFPVENFLQQYVEETSNQNTSIISLFEDYLV